MIDCCLICLFQYAIHNPLVTAPSWRLTGFSIEHYVQPTICTERTVRGASPQNVSVPIICRAKFPANGAIDKWQIRRAVGETRAGDGVSITPRPTNILDKGG